MTLTSSIILVAGDVDWMNLIILAIIFGMPVLGGIAKWLIKSFGGQVPGEKPEQKGTPSATAEQTAPSPPRPAPRPTTPTRPAPARSRPQVSSTQSRPAPPPPRRQPLSVSPRQARPVRPGSRSTPRPTPVVIAQESRDEPESLEQRHIEAYGSPIDDRHIELALTDEDVILASTEAAAQKTARPSPVMDHLGLSSPPSKTDLRRAIVLSEILRPPLSIREQDDGWS